jgi:hypothetical protein
VHHNHLRASLDVDPPAHESFPQLKQRAPISVVIDDLQTIFLCDLVERPLR